VLDIIRGASDPVQAAKRYLLLTGNRGAFVRRCPGTREYTCCDYVILHIGTFCTMDCAYCILQSYFPPPRFPAFRQHGRHAAGTRGKTEAARNPPHRNRRIYGQHDLGTLGTAFRIAGSPFRTAAAGVLELKTKTVNVERLEALDHNRKTIAAWSVNTDRVIDGEERWTEPLDQRLAAAARCQRWGYPLAFHFDPIILYDNCREEYLEVVDRIFTIVAPDNIVWISLGTFRFMPDLKGVIQQRFARSKIVYGEFIQGLDRKQRYFKPLRIEIYKAIADRIRSHAPDTTVYFCMEDGEVWQKVFGFIPEQKGGLGHMLDESAARVCDLAPAENPSGHGAKRLSSPAQ
jgi:spore photoproduct lyase